MVLTIAQGLFRLAARVRANCKIKSNQIDLRALGGNEWLLLEPEFSLAAIEVSLPLPLKVLRSFLPILKRDCRICAVCQRDSLLYASDLFSLAASADE